MRAKIEAVVIIDWPESYEEPSIHWCRTTEEARKEYEQAKSDYDNADVYLLSLTDSSLAVSRRIAKSTDQ